MFEEESIFLSIVNSTFIVSCWGNSTKLPWNSTTANFCRRRLQPWQLLRRQSWTPLWFYGFTNYFEILILAFSNIIPGGVSACKILPFWNEHFQKYKALKSYKLTGFSIWPCQLWRVISPNPYKTLSWNFLDYHLIYWNNLGNLYQILRWVMFSLASLDMEWAVTAFHMCWICSWANQQSYSEASF